MWLGDDCQRNLECLALWRIIQITIHIGTDKNLISKFVWISTFSINSSPMLSTYSFLTIHLLPFPLVARRCRRPDPTILTSVCVMGSERYVVCECERKITAYWHTAHWRTDWLAITRSHNTSHFPQLALRPRARQWLARFYLLLYLNLSAPKAQIVEELWTIS